MYTIYVQYLYMYMYVYLRKLVHEIMNLKIKSQRTPHHRRKNKNATATSKIGISDNTATTTTTNTTSCCHHECDVSLHAGWGAVELQWQPRRHKNYSNEIKCGCCQRLMHLHKYLCVPKCARNINEGCLKAEASHLVALCMCCIVCCNAGIQDENRFITGNIHCVAVA